MKNLIALLATIMLFVLTGTVLAGEETKSGDEWWHQMPNREFRLKFDSQYEYGRQHFDSGGVAINPDDYKTEGSRLGWAVSIGWGNDLFHIDAFSTGNFTEKHPRYEPTYFGTTSPTKFLCGVAGIEFGVTPWKSNLELFVQVAYITNDFDFDKDSKFPVEFTGGLRWRELMFEAELYAGNHRAGGELTWYFAGGEETTWGDSNPTLVPKRSDFISEAMWKRKLEELDINRLSDIGPRFGLMFRTCYTYSLGGTETYDGAREYIRQNFTAAGGFRLTFGQHMSFYVLYQWTWERGAVDTLRPLTLFTDSVVVGLKFEF